MQGIILKLCLFSMILFGGLILTYIIVRYPDNHGGLVAASFYYFSFVSIFLLIRWICTGSHTYWVLCVSLCSLLLCFVINGFNISLFGYETWIERGMPQWGTFQINKQTIVDVDSRSHKGLFDIPFMRYFIHPNDE